MIVSIPIAPKNAVRLLLLLSAVCSLPLGALAQRSSHHDLTDALHGGVEVASQTSHSFFRRAEERTPFFIVSAVLIPVLVLMSGVFAGLTLGYMSLDETQLKVLSVSGSPKQQEYARKIAPIRKNGHLLLITLLIANMVVNETLPVISDQVLGGGVQAVVVSTVLIVIFAEIIPQSVCSRYGLVVGAKMAGFVRVLIFALFIICWPVAKLLEAVLGHHHGIIYRRGELKELINMHAALGEHGGDLRTDTVTIVGGALDLQEKVAADAMTPIDKAFMLHIDSHLDYQTLATVVKSGHSRVPVFEVAEIGGRKVTKILGILLVKQCVLLDPEDATPLRDIPLNAVPTLPFDEPLLGILDRFQEGRSHMAIVSRLPRRTREASLKDESVNEIRESMTRRFFRRFGGGDSGSEGSDEEEGGQRGKKRGNSENGDIENGNSATEHKGRGKHPRKHSAKHNGDVEMGPVVDENISGREAVEADSNDKTKKKNKGSKGPKEQTMPADALLDPDRADEFLQSLEGGPLGLITLEDVLEELIGEEILDEFDLTGPHALPASSYVPPEAQRAVDAAVARATAAAKAQSRLGAAVKPVVQVSRPIGAALSKGIREFKFGVERSRSAPGRTRDEPSQANANGDEAPGDAKTELGLPPLDEASQEPKAALTKAFPSIDGSLVPTGKTSSEPMIPLPMPTIVFQLPEAEDDTSDFPSRQRQPSSSLPAHVINASLGSDSRRGSPAPSLTEAILLERGRRRVAAQLLTGASSRTPGTPDLSGTAVMNTAGAAPPSARDLEERLAGVGGVRGKGSRYKSSPLVGGEKTPTTIPTSEKDLKREE